jgi:dTDP-glucose pyrophosphorylase
MLGVITAAGRGIRLHPNSKRLQKCLLEVDGKSILQRNISIMRNQMGIEVIYILVGYKKEQITKMLGDGKGLDVQLKYVDVGDVSKGLANGILQLEKHIKDDFCLMLGDEVYHDSNHHELPGFLDRNFSVVCAVKEERHSYIIKKNYSVDIKNDRIISLVEKPDDIKNKYLGCGTYLFKPSIFQHIRSASISTENGGVELTDVIDSIDAKNGPVLPFTLKGDYINVNNIDDYNAANYMLRTINFNKKRVSLIIPAYNEEYSIGYVIDEFIDRVDEILVINNNSADKTKEISEAKGVKVFTGDYKGYGDALKFGMENATGDIFVLVEADGSFFARDLGKILEYMKDADMVLGTRTTKQMIEQAANMNLLLRIGNLVVAKFIELLWLYKSEPRLTDVGCTYRAIWKLVYYDIRDSLRGVGPEFSPEMIIEAMRYNKRIIEIPVTYSGRLGGESKFSANMLANFITALRMLKLIMQKKILDIFK